MRPLDLVQARYFCTPGPAPALGIEQPLGPFVDSLGTHPTLVEGTPGFDIYRHNLLMSVERWLAFSAVHYRRALEMLTPASAPWAQVTLYYASFFSANALLGMFGVWIGQTRVVDVESGSVGSQVLRAHRGVAARSPNGERGSHLRFWDHFYSTAVQLRPWAPAALQHALDPASVGTYGWQIGARNEVNYDMFHAWGTSKHLHTNLDPGRLNSLSGPLRLQFDTTQDLIRLGMQFAGSLQLGANGLVGCGFDGARTQIQRQLARKSPPDMLRQSAFAQLIG